MKIKLVEKDLIKIIKSLGMDYMRLPFNEPNYYTINYKGVDYEIYEIFHENGLSDFEIRML